ncbi:MAG: hypothetical protein ACLFPJ_04290 [Candidatus Woesearchaeota archaeon]
MKKSKLIYNNLLTIYSLDNIPEKGKNVVDNFYWFKNDYLDGIFDNYEGFAVYHKGILCGIGPSKINKEAEKLYGKSSLTTFKIPENKKKLKNSLNKSYQEYQGLFTIDDLLKDL